MVINNSVKNPGIFCPHIKTEETIKDLLIRDSKLMSDEYEYIPYPLAHWINTIGVPKTQDIINSLKPNKKLFVCQHILVSHLRFNKSDIVFTPHSSIKDNYHTIPHYAVNVDRSLSKDNRDVDFSFLGSISTHTIRKKLVGMYDDTCYDSGVHWGLDKKLKGSFTEKYISLLGNSNFSICPRGTGISSVRLFESMAMGSIPIIIADDYQPPLSDRVDWREISISVKESDISNIKSIVKNYSNEEILKIRKKLLNVYNTYFNNDNLHKTITTLLK